MDNLATEQVVQSEERLTDLPGYTNDEQTSDD